MTTSVLSKSYKPTPAHKLAKLLQDKDKLLRLYTQNIDNLDIVAGVREENVVEVHGHSRTACCRKCGWGCPISDLASDLHLGKIPRCKNCGEGVMKPNVVFFGESLPYKYHINVDDDLARADLVIAIGTSLSVAPVNQIPDKAPLSCPRVLINRDLVGSFVTDDKNYRDVVLLGDCNDGARGLAAAAGWSLS